MKEAVLVIDMLNDFVTGALRCARVQTTIAPLQRLLRAARDRGVPVIYCNDAHIPGVDHELTFRKPHAIRGTPGAEVIPELKAEPRDFVVPKRRYSGFFETDLDALLRELKVERVILTGVHTHMCVRHTAADAFFRGYRIAVVAEGTQAFTEEDYTKGLQYLKEVYAAEIVSVEALIARWTGAPAGALSEV